MDKEEIKKIREQAVVELMHLLRTGRIQRHTSNKDALAMVEMNLENQQIRIRLEGRNLEAIVLMPCVKHIYKNEQGRLMADVAKDPTGLKYEAMEGDYIVCGTTNGLMDEYGTVEPQDWKQ